MNVPFEVPAHIFRTSPRPFTDEYSRQCHRVLRMVSILHNKGFHGLRVYPYEYPLAYRVEIFPSTYVSRNGVAYNDIAVEKLNQARLIARHSGANGSNYFGWEDAAFVDAPTLALLFIQRFPDLCREAYYLDYAYAGWFATLMGHCDYGYLPYLHAEYEDEMDRLSLRSVSGGEKAYFPLPPKSDFGHTLSPPRDVEFLRR